MAELPQGFQDVELGFIIDSGCAWPTMREGWNLRQGFFSLTQPYFRSSSASTSRPSSISPTASTSSTDKNDESEPPLKRRRLLDVARSSAGSSDVIAASPKAELLVDELKERFLSLSSRIAATKTLELKIVDNEDNGVDFPLELRGTIPTMSIPRVSLGPIEALKTDTLFHREFSSSSGSLLNIGAEKYLIPPGASFLMSDFGDLSHYIDALGNDFNLIVLDPPWQSKSVNRGQNYATMHHSALARIPLERFMSKTIGGLVLVWVTNNPEHTKFVKEALFPKWGVTHVSTWYWVKVTNDGEPALPFESPQRKPYEPLIIGRVAPFVPSSPSLGESRLLVSVPGPHSMKPPIIPLFKALMGCSAATPVRSLELFARNLLPDSTAWGNEVLKHQHTAHYTQPEQITTS